MGEILAGTEFCWYQNLCLLYQDKFCNGPQIHTIWKI